MPHISYQLYCSRKFPPLSKTLQMLARAGYSEVEGFGGLYGDVPGLMSELAAAGLAMTSAHVNVDLLRDKPGDALALCKTLGVSRAYAPFLQAGDRPADAAGWRAFAAELHTLGAPLRDAGLTFGWHNHDFELVDLGGGVTPLEILADAGLMLELDLGWVRIAGSDPVDTIRKYEGRIGTVHVKDIAPEGEATDEDGWADVGHGVMDWPAILAALADAGVDHMVVEHDNPSDDERFATRSMATLTSLAGASA